MNSHEYLLVLNTAFMIQKEYQTEPVVGLNPEIEREKHHWKGLREEGDVLFCGSLVSNGNFFAMSVVF